MIKASSLDITWQRSRQATKNTEFFLSKGEQVRLLLFYRIIHGVNYCDFMLILFVLYVFYVIMCTWY